MITARVNYWHRKQQTDATVYEGTYLGPNGIRIKGRIVENQRRPTDVFAWDPPLILRQHPKHGPCWQLYRPGQKWFLLHWEKPAWDFETSQLYVEEMLAEAYAASISQQKSQNRGCPLNALLFLSVLGSCLAALNSLAIFWQQRR